MAKSEEINPLSTMERSEEIIIGITLVINVIFSVFLLILLVYRQSKVESVNTRKCCNCTPWRLLHNLTYAAIGSFILCALTFGIFLLDDIAADELADIILYRFVIFTWHIGQILTYILLMLRVHYAFKDTQYASSPRVNLIFSALLFIYILCDALFLIGAVVHYLASDNYTAVYLFVTWVIVIEISDLLITIFLISTFVKKMVLFAVNMHNSFIKDPNELNQQQKRLLNVMTRYFLLSTIATLTTQVVLVLGGIYMLQFFVLYINHEGLMFAFCFAALMQLYANNICLFLTFDVNEELYAKLCKCCNKMVMVHVQKITQKKVSQRNYQLKVRLLKEGSNPVMIQESVLMNSKIGISTIPITDNDDNVDEDDEGSHKNATQYIQR